MNSQKYPESCSCQVCSRACKFNPGWFLPGEAEKAASLLGLTLKDFFDKYLGVNWWEKEAGYDDDVFVLAPALVTMPPGEEYPADPRGVCIFLKENKCQIHDAKPHECRSYIHSDTKDDVHNRHKFVADEWLKNQDQIKTLLGRNPSAKAFGGLGLFGI
jgi:Fe-S-cluster containining protein